MIHRKNTFKGIGIGFGLILWSFSSYTNCLAFSEDTKEPYELGNLFALPDSNEVVQNTSYKNTQPLTNSDVLNETWEYQTSKETPMLQEMIQQQETLNRQMQADQTERNHLRQLREMLDEAMFLASLNVAWIQDTLANFDCRLAEKRSSEADQRITHLQDSHQRIQKTCADLRSNALAQADVCHEHEGRINAAIERLQKLSNHYDGNCQ